MGASKEYLFNVGFIVNYFPDITGALPRPNLRINIHSNDLGRFGNLGVFSLDLDASTGAEQWQELGTAFIESQRMAEVQNSTVRAGEWQVIVQESNGLYGVPAHES